MELELELELAEGSLLAVEPLLTTRRLQTLHWQSGHSLPHSRPSLTRLEPPVRQLRLFRGQPR